MRGGIENARILLYSNGIMSNGVGNFYDTVGRFLMDHPRDPGYTLRFDMHDAAEAEALFRDLIWSGRGLYGLALSHDLQRRDGLLNCAAWPINSPAAYQQYISNDDWVRAARRLVRGPRVQAMRDAAIVITRPGIIARALRSRLLGQRVPLEFFFNQLGFAVTSE